MAQIEHKTVNDSEDELLSQLDRDGGVIIEGILNNQGLEQVEAWRLPGQRIFLFNLVLQNPFFRYLLILEDPAQVIHVSHFVDT